MKLISVITVLFLFASGLFGQDPEFETTDPVDHQKVEQVFSTLNTAGFEAAKVEVEIQFGMGPTQFEGKLVQEAEYDKASEWNAAMMQSQEGGTDQEPTGVPTPDDNSGTWPPQNP